MVPIGVQLYSLRDEPESRLEASLERLAEAGFSAVEPAGLWGRSPAEFRAACAEAGLEIASVHAPLELDVRGAALDRHLEAVAELGATAAVVPLIEAERFATRAGISRLADLLNRWSERAESLGLRLGYHNHEWEFSQRFDGVSAHRLLFEELSPLVFAQIDVYWARVGGADPAAEIAYHGERARSLHLKDGPAKDCRAPMTALGQGALDLPAVLACSRAVCHIVEIDFCAGDLWSALEDSARYLRERGPSL